MKRFDAWCRRTLANEAYIEVDFGKVDQTPAGSRVVDASMNWTEFSASKKFFFDTRWQVSRVIDLPAQDFWNLTVRNFPCSFKQDNWQKLL